MARKVNTKFLIILTLVVGGGLVAVLLAQKLLNRRDPDALVAESETHLANQRYDDALLSMQRAVNARPEDPALRVKLGDVYMHRIHLDRGEFPKALGAWRSALEVNPSYLPALERLLAIFRVESQRSGSPDVINRTYTELRDLASRIAAQQPDNYAMAGLVQAAVIEPWTRGVTTPEPQIHAAVEALQKLMELDPAGASHPYWIARAHLQFATNQPANQRQALIDQALSVIDEALERQPENAEMYWRAATIQQIVASLQEQESVRDQYLARAKDLARRASELAKPDNENYLQIMSHAASMALQDQDLARANQIMQQVVEALPDNQEARLIQARVLATDPSRRADAIKILETPVKAAAVTPETVARDLELITLADLVEMRIEYLSQVNDPAQRQQIIPKIEAELARLVQRLGDQHWLVRLSGDFAAARGDLVEAIKAYERAREMASLEGATNDRKYYEMLLRLARAYRRLGQTGQAIALLDQVLNVAPGHVPSRLELTELLLEDRDIARARQQLALLRQFGATPQQLQAVELTIAMVEGDQATSASLYRTLPEETPAQMRNKATVALRLNRRDEVIRLLEAARKVEPDRVNIPLLVSLYVADNQPAKARELVDEALAADPNNRQLQMLAQQIENPDPQQLEDFRRETILGIEDEFTREIQLFDLERDLGNHEAALQHLRRAAELRPDDLGVKSAMFQVALHERDWNRAEELARELAAADHDDAGGALIRFQLALARGQTAEALEHAREAVRRLPHFARSYVALGQALAAQGRFDDAVTEFRRALERRSNNVEALRGIIGCYYALNQPDNARRYIEQARRIRPNDPYFAELELDYIQRYGDPTQAFAARERAVEQRPDDPMARLQLGQVYQQAARYAESRRNSQAATQHLNKAADVYRKAIEKWPDELQFYASLAEVQVALEQVDRAEQTLRQILQRDAWKETAAPHQLLAEFYARLGRIPQAEFELRQAMIKSGSDMTVRLQLANFLSQIGKVNEALAELEGVRNHPAAQRQRVEILLRAGQVKLAEEALQQAIDANPDALDLKAQLASVYFATERYDQAMRVVGEVLAQDGENVLALLTRGRIRVVRGETDAAIADLNRVLELSKQNVDARLALAAAYRQRNNWDAAIRQLEEAVSIQPLNKVLRQQLVDMYASAQPSPRWLEAQRLVDETRQMPQFQNDPDWAAAAARLWRRRGVTENALAAIADARRLSGDDTLLMDEYLQVLLNARDYRRILRETETLAAGDEAPAWVYHFRAMAQKGLNDRAAALAEYERGIARAEARNDQAGIGQLIQSLGREIGADDAIRHMGDRIDTEPAWQLLALHLYHQSNQLDAGLALLNRVDQSKLTDVQKQQFLRIAGLIYSSVSPVPMAEEARDAYLQLLDLDPDAIDVLNNLAYLLMDTMRPSQPEQAVIYSQRAMDLLSRQGRSELAVQDTHGWILTHLPGRLDEGLNILLEVANRGADFPDVYYHLGEAYLRKGSVDNAIPQLERAQQVINDAEARGFQHYGTLKVRVEQALDRARLAARDKAAAAD